MKGLRPEDDDYAGESGQRNGDLGGDPEGFIRFHGLRGIKN
jgi:hypothetical protein